MNPSSKLLVAAALIAGGYGLATLLGTPAAHSVSSSSSLEAGAPPPAGWDWQATSTGAGIVGSVRLLPEPNTVRPAGDDGTSASPSALATDTHPALPASDLPLPLGEGRGEGALPTHEAPLPCPLPSGEGYEATFSQPPAQQVSLNRPPDIDVPASALVPVGPLADQIHVVIDGDSLARLAGRYLGDPHRAEEIYRLNRDVLSSPDLLPIGAELRIPAERRAGRVDDEPSDTQDGDTSARSQHGLVPVSPAAPTTTVAAPRAQLLRPLPAR